MPAIEWTERPLVAETPVQSIRAAGSLGSEGLVQHSVEAGLDGLGRLDRNFLRELPKLPILCGDNFESLAASGGRKMHDIQQRPGLSEPG